MLRKRLTVFCSFLLALSFAGNTISLSIECSFKDGSYWSVLVEPYACIVYNIQGTENVKESITDVTGSIRDGLTYKDVKVVDIRGFCNFIPDAFDNYFENIEGFSSYNTSMITVSKADLKQFPKLRELWIYFNLLEFLPSDLFEFNPHIEYIHFNNNKIKFIGPEIFSNVPKLYSLKLSSNNCIQRSVDDVKMLQLLKREIKKKCSSETGPSEISHEITSLQTDYLYLKIAKLEKEILELKDSNKHRN